MRQGGEVGEDVCGGVLVLVGLGSHTICASDRELGDGHERKQYVQAGAEGGAEVMIGGVNCHRLRWKEECEVEDGWDVGRTGGAGT